MKPSEFMKLPLEERRRIMREQCDEELVRHYEEEGYSARRTMSRIEDRAERVATEWASSELAQSLANFYECSATTFLGQQSTFQAHIDGQNTGYKNGFIAGARAALEEARINAIEIKKGVKVVELSHLEDLFKEEDHEQR